MAGAGVGEAMAISALIGAGVGGATSAATGQDPLKGALIGGIGGAVTGGAMGAMGGATTAATESGLQAAATGATQLGEEAAKQAMEEALRQGASQAQAEAMAQSAREFASNAAGNASMGYQGIPMLDQGAALPPSVPGGAGLQATGGVAGAQASGANVANNGVASLTNPGGTFAQPLNQNAGTFGQGFYKGISDNATPAMVGGAGILGLSAINADKKKFGVPEEEHYDGPLNQFKYNPNTFRATYPTPPNPAYEAQYQNYRTTPYAEGGITDIDTNYAKGGIAGLLKGRGDGMSDSIRATIADKQPARLADGEFVVPADVVSHLGNGSTDAGAKHLYKMMDKVRHARTGSKKQGRQIAAGGYLPA